ncbi:MAG TPA: DNA polymerase III subunit beta [Dysgonamonadaceae bacterium]|jgi:DNA polymerase-3 subunit beta|nr:DNA polymerase III subunit beta [Dysgonamonadaceae bacterium]HPD43335.1 DNA polymerase III subunit beta [Dysgonamonadaceae bacterium]HRS40456.1 DNA polymerase III subunit beta [Dysgonamonadaceae bacterium]HRU12834.1 DNA polymerase III subunit beta [Dysgonamonadaceae bacterium]
MKFVVSSSNLLNHSQAISRVINSKKTLSILDCFLLELKGNALSLTAADNESRLQTTIDVSNEGSDGSVAINAKNLLDPLRELPDQPLTFEINDDTLEVNIFYHNGKYNFIGLKSEEYPEPKQLSDNVMTFRINAQDLFNGINRTIFATADDELRPVMNGIFFDLTPEGLTFVGSDGHKLVRFINKAVKSEGRSSFILSKKPANLLRALLPRETGEIEIRFDEDQAYVVMQDYTMLCRFTEGRYPNYNSVIPKNNPNSVTIDRLSLLNALKRVSVFTSPAIGLIKMQFSEDSIVVSAQDIDFLTSAEETIPCTYHGNVLNIGFKALFLIDILNNIPSADVRIELSDPSRAGVVFPAENEENEDMLALLMPMMLND